MTQTNFTVMSKLQEARFSPEHFEGGHDALNSFLKLFIEFTFRIPNDIHSFNLSGIRAVLRLYNPSIQLSEVNLPVGIHVHRDEYKQGVWFHFPISEKAIHLIEKNRTGAVGFIVEIHTQTTLLTKSQRPEILVQNEYAHPLQFNVPRSEWVEKILPKLGYRTFKLFEIPLLHDKLNEAYSDIITEFELATEYFNKPDYNKCVAHCRHTLDSLKRNLKKIKELGDSETAFQWLKAVDQHTFEWIDNVEKNTAALAGKTHHSGLKRDFKRWEAESIYLVTMGLMNFIGHISKD